MTAAVPDSPDRVLRCPRCRQSDQVALEEVHEEVGVTDPGTVFIINGALVPPSVWWFNPGDSVSLHAECAACGHHWRPRTQRVAP